MFEKIYTFLDQNDFYFSSNGNYIFVDTTDQGMDEGVLEENGIILKKGDYLSHYG